MPFAPGCRDGAWLAPRDACASFARPVGDPSGGDHLVLLPILAAAAALLVLAGAAKLRAPRGAGIALRAAGLPGGTALAAAIGAGEIALGAACLLRPGPAGWAIAAVAYAGFACVQLRGRRRARKTGRSRGECACFGTASASGHPVQVALDVIGAGAALAAVWVAPPGLAWVIDRPAAVAGGLMVGLAGVIYGAYLAFAVLPGAWSALGRSAGASAHALPAQPRPFGAVRRPT